MILGPGAQRDGPIQSMNGGAGCDQEISGPTYPPGFGPDTNRSVETIVAETQCPHSDLNNRKGCVTPNKLRQGESYGVNKKQNLKKANIRKKKNKKCSDAPKASVSCGPTETESESSGDESSGVEVRLRKKAAKVWKIGEQAGLVVEEKGRAIQALLEDWVEKKSVRKQTKRRKSRGHKKAKDDKTGEGNVSQ